MLHDYFRKKVNKEMLYCIKRINLTFSYETEQNVANVILRFILSLSVELWG